MHAAQRAVIRVCGAVCLRGTPEKGADYLLAQIVTDIGSVSWKKYKVGFFGEKGILWCNPDDPRLGSERKWDWKMILFHPLATTIIE